VTEHRVPAVLSIAGSDSGGGAGIQADLKAFARSGVHGMTAVTALTAQNTVGVTGIHGVPGAFIVEQVRAVADDIGVDAVKIGMLGTADTVRAVREALALLDPGTPIVLDPVMVSESGAVLLDEAARAAIVAELLPVVTVITPNVPEARVLAGSDDDVEQLAQRAERLQLVRDLVRAWRTAQQLAIDQLYVCGLEGIGRHADGRC
jgi:hydroxymethylpyrimidine/phosphomethylpyrimidine kinase